MSVSTSAKARLRRNRICDPDRHQNLIICNSHCQPSLKISCKSVWNFLRKVPNRQTDKQINRQTNNDDYISSLAEVTNAAINVSCRIIADVWTRCNKIKQLQATLTLLQHLFYFISHARTALYNSIGWQACCRNKNASNRHWVVTVHVDTRHIETSVAALI